MNYHLAQFLTEQHDYKKYFLHFGLESLPTVPNAPPHRRTQSILSSIIRGP